MKQVVRIDHPRPQPRDGEFLGAFGRRGQGPGEMQSLQSLARLAPDTFALLDSAQGRVLLLDRSG